MRPKSQHSHRNERSNLVLPASSATRLLIRRNPKSRHYLRMSQKCHEPKFGAHRQQIALGFSKPAHYIARGDDLGKFVLEIGERHRVDLIGGDVLPVDALKVECPCGITH
jgi:hypothetical protein